MDTPRAGCRDRRWRAGVARRSAAGMAPFYAMPHTAQPAARPRTLGKNDAPTTGVVHGTGHGEGTFFLAFHAPETSPMPLEIGAGSALRRIKRACCGHGGPVLQSGPGKVVRPASDAAAQLPSEGAPDSARVEHAVRGRRGPDRSSAAPA